MELTFEQINGLVFEAIQPSKSESRIFMVIGEWYYRFVNSNEKKLTLTVPFYSDGIPEAITEYLYFFESTLKLVESQPLNSFDGTFLFDIFKYSSSSYNTRKEEDFRLPFKKSVNNNIHLFGDSTVTKEDQFLPVFKSDGIRLRNDEKVAVHRLFKLFKAIRKSSLISHPVLINIDENCLSLISANSISIPANIGLLNIISKGQTVSELRDLNAELKEHQLIPAISILYPYNTGISARIESTLPKSRHFRLVFRNRFSYPTIGGSDIQLLPTEFLVNENQLIRKASIKIIDTNHSKELFDLFEELKRGWKNAQFNPYITPFPAKWFMCIHSGEELSFWKNEFEKNFRSVSQNLLSICINIIEHLYNLNWINQIIDDKAIDGIILPTSKNHQEVIDSLKSYIKNVRQDIIFHTIDDFEEQIPKSTVVLDCFNLIEIVNWCQRFKPDGVCLNVPDFIYFNHYSFFQYRILKYQYLSLKDGLRAELDLEYDKNLLFGNTLTDTLNEARSNRTRYIFKYKEEPETELKITDEDVEIDELDFSESEVIEIIDSKDNTENLSGQLIVFTESGAEIRMSSNDSVIVIDKGFVTTKNAGMLLAKDSFVPPFNLKNVVEIELMINRLSQMSEKGRSWQVQLNDRKILNPNLYKVLLNKGLVLKEYQFEKGYLETRIIPELPTNFPKRLHNWKIVSEFLGISSQERDESWILYYGKSDLNKLKALYRTVLNVLIQENLFGQLENNSVANRMVEFVSQSDCFNLDEMGMNELEVAQSIIESIHRHLNFLQVNRISVLNHE
jgi:hypothetical protein